MPELDAEHRNQMAAVLTEHRLISDRFSPLCACEKWRNKRDHDGSGHRAHVADALAPLVAGWIADALVDRWADAWDVRPLLEARIRRARADAWDAGNLSGMRAPACSNPYRGGDDG